MFTYIDIFNNLVINNNSIFFDKISFSKYEMDKNISMFRLNFNITEVKKNINSINFRMKLKI